MIKTVKKYLVPHAENDYKPHLLRERAVTVVACIALVLFCTSLGSSYILNKTDFGAAVLPSVLVDLTNNQRLAEGGKALAVNGTLEAAALMKAKDMAENHYFAHTSPTGISPWYWFSKAGYRFSYAGENLAVNFNESTDVENAWIASPTHYANLISDKFDETGIATYQGTYEGQPTTFVVQLFGKQSASTRTSAPVNNKKVTSIEEAKPTPKVAVAPEVKGESIALKQAPVDPKEPAPVLMVEDPTFTVAQNINETQPAPTQNSSLTKYSTVAERLLVHQARYVQYIYLGLIALIYLVLIAMIVIEIRTQHFKNIALAVLLLCLLGGLSYINSSFILSFV